jgi:hypothetical protein
VTHTPPTGQQLDLDAIEARATARRAALSGWINCYSPLPEQEALENAEAVLEENVPALVAEVRRLRAELITAKADTLGEVATELESIDFHPDAKSNCRSLCRMLAGRFRRKAMEQLDAVRPAAVRAVPVTGSQPPPPLVPVPPMSAAGEEPL